jgi:hypothetical protein
MTINLNRIDAIEDYDEAIEALEDFVGELIDEFIESSEGKTYLKANPEMEEYVGSWIDHLIYFGYNYESITLPRMTKNHVEAIVTRLFPNKVSLLDPDEADTTIPELIAFWQFLKREYKLANATKIIKFLEKIQPQFKGMMNDPNNFGIAKSFLTAGMNAGFDMTSEEGIKAFQEEYNQNIRESAANSPISNGLGKLLGNFNSQQENRFEQTSPQQELQNLLSSLTNALEIDSDSSEDSIEDYHRQMRTSMWHSAAEEMPPLSKEAIALLKKQKIDETEPGTLLKDFQTLLDFIGEKGIAVSGKQNLLSLKYLGEINQRLSEPIQTDLKRPQQKSYPPINGLYLLLRASGLGKIVNQGKKAFLKLDRELLSSWKDLNPTERYFTLLEAWLIRAYEEMLGDRRSPLNEGTKCLQYWPRIPEKGEKIRNYNEQQSLNYWPELHNLALMKLFGFVQLESGKPEAGKGWRVKTIKKLPFGEAMMQAIARGFIEQGMVWESEENLSVPFGEMKPILQSYFREWKNTLAVPEFEFRAGVYVFKVYLGKIWRRIAISSQMSLADLSGLILESVDFDSDHLDMFRYKNQLGRTIEVSHPYADDGYLSTDEVNIGDLPLHEGSSMEYIFDFGDWWEFSVQLEKIETEDLRDNYGAIIESYGDAPPQYPDWDEEE